MGQMALEKTVKTKRSVTGASKKTKKKLPQCFHPLCRKKVAQSTRNFCCKDHYHEIPSKLRIPVLTQVEHCEFTGEPGLPKDLNEEILQAWRKAWWIKNKKGKNDNGKLSKKGCSRKI